MRKTVLFAAVALLCLVGTAGLLRGLLVIEPNEGSTADHHTDEASESHASTNEIRIRNVYIPEPASPDVAAAYLTMENIGEESDRLTSVFSGAARQTTIHDVPGAPAVDGAVQAEPGVMTHDMSVVLRPGQSIALRPGNGHFMLEQLIGPLHPGDHVSLVLTFEHTGPLLVDAPVIGIFDTPPDNSGGD